MASYVKWFEAAGARVVPVIMGESWDVTLEKLSKLNGIFFPGGDGDFYAWGKPMFDQVKDYNDLGQIYPMWGTCLGFESMAGWASDLGEPTIGNFVAENISMTIDFTVDPRETKMFSSLGESAFLYS